MNAAPEGGLAVLIVFLVLLMPDQSIGDALAQIRDIGLALLILAALTVALGHYLQRDGPHNTARVYIKAGYLMATVGVWTMAFYLLMLAIIGAI